MELLKNPPAGRRFDIIEAQDAESDRYSQIHRIECGNRFPVSTLPKMVDRYMDQIEPVTRFPENDKPSSAQELCRKAPVCGEGPDDAEKYGCQDTVANVSFRNRILPVDNAGKADESKSERKRNAGCTPG